ncbi:hypothetical protein [Rummeliibacillus sp. POC4]|uniref:hypothetical protein n=1 Tax=Rummeliibacillus sp. POC4 TaxID=2305899 RepID=UPI000E66A64A|nr:hypothetical protein [Rummeliibacillus sp. POC4]RIJ62847.1 hypothetical protein D1606_18045 [Rummeliibacillus sp. POC4]
MKLLRFIFFVIFVFCFWYSVNIEKFQYVEKAAVFQEKIEPMSEFTVDSSKEIPDREITLREAILISIEIAKQYDPNPELLNINSVADKKGTGKDGKKPNWNSMVSLPHANYRMSVTIVNGKLKEYKFLDPSDDKPIKNIDISIDSDTFIQKAIQKYNLKPIKAKNSAKENYHFKIQRNDEQMPIFSIEGYTKSGEYMEIYFNPLNGSYLGKGIKQFENGGKSD